MFLLLFKLLPFVMLIVLLVMIGTNNVQYSQHESTVNNSINVTTDNICKSPEKSKQPNIIIKLHDA